MRRSWLVVLTGAAGALLACGGGGSEPNEPLPGVLTVSLTTPNADDAALLLTLTGPAAPSAVTAADPALRVFLAGPPGPATSLVVTGAMTDGAILTLQVPDVRQVKEYTATLVEVASTTYQVRPLTGYRLRVSR